MEATLKVPTESTQGEKHHAPRAGTDKRKPTKAQKVLLGSLALALLAGLVLWLLGRGTEATDDAFVEGHVVNIASRAAGQVVKVLVEDNQVVEAGQTLVELDPSELEARVQVAKADLAQAEAQLALTETNAQATLKQAKGALTQATSGLSSSQAQFRQAKADVVQARSREHLAQVELQRALQLKKEGVVAAAELDTHQSVYDQAKAQLEQAEARLRSAETGITGSAGGIEQAEGKLASANTAPVQVQAAQARVDQAKAALRLAEVNLAYAQVKSSVRGVVSRRTVEPGQVVAPGTPLMAIIPLDDVWVVANFKEDQIGEIKPGQVAEVKIDSFSGLSLEGRVASLAGATGSKFALLPPDNASGNFVKVVQRVPVLIRFKDLAHSGLTLRPGMSAYVRVHTDKTHDAPASESAAQ